MKTLDDIKNNLYSAFAIEIQRRLGLPNPPTLHEGDILKTILDVLAVQLYNIELEQNRLKFYADLNSYEGEELTEKAREFGLERQPPSPAVGTLTLTQQDSGSGTIPAGTVFTKGNKSYISLDSVNYLGSGLSYDVQVQAEKEGSNYNAFAQEINGEIIINTTTFSFINNTPIMGGRDEEDDDSLRTRIINKMLATQSNATYSYWYNKIINYSYGDYRVKSLNFYEDFLTYSATLFIDLGLTDYSGFIKSGEEVILITDNATSHIFLSKNCLLFSGGLPKVYYTQDYYSPSWIELTPYQNDPTINWDFTINLSTGEVIFNNDINTQDKLSGFVISAGNGIKIQYYYYDNIFQKIQELINNERILGLNLIVRPAEIYLINMEVKVYLKREVDLDWLTSQIQQSVNNFTESLNIGEDVVLQQIIARVLTQFREYVRKIEFVSPTNDISIKANQKARLHNIIIQYA